MWSQKRTAWRRQKNGGTVYRYLALLACCLVIGLVVLQANPQQDGLPNVIGPHTVRFGYTEHSLYQDAPRNCTEARARGLQDIPVSSRYYAPWLDRDQDGLACEPWPP